MAETKRILNKTIEQKVSKFIHENELINENEKLLIALSGGPDSVFAFTFLNKYKEKFKIEIFAAHVNHDLRGKSSDEDAEFCKELSASFNVKYFEQKADVKKFAKENKISIEEAARKIRYNFFEKIAKENSIDKIITAHNLSDNAETVILNLVKGTGLKGISGIPVKRGIIIRPFLILSKDEITNYLSKNGINFRIDESNLSNDYERNFIRNKIIPLIKTKINPAVEKNIFNSSQVFKNAAIFFEENLKEIFEKYISANNDEVKIDIDLFEKYSAEISGNLLKEILERYFESEFEYTDFLKFKNLIKKETGKKEQLKNRIYVYKDRDYIYINRLKKKDFEPLEIKIGNEVETGGKKIKIQFKEKNEFKLTGNKNHEFINGDNLAEKFILRRWQPGDKFIPLGMKNFKKISDFLCEQKLSHIKKEEQLVLQNGNEIIWVPGFRIDDRFKVTEKTKRICELWLK